MPVMDIDTALARRGAMVKFVEAILVKDTDFGVIPGTGTKATLLKPGAEKLTTFFGLSKRFVIVEKVEDWTGKAHDGEAFFYYLYRCQLWRGDLLVAESDGSCNSFESKYRWRKSERICPDCGQPAIIKGKAEYGGGWLCYKAKGGCGAKFRDGEQQIESQQVGQVANPDIASQVNTIQKMAQKRALIAATLLAVNASEFFTQDFCSRCGSPTPRVMEKFNRVMLPAGSFDDDPGAKASAHIFASSRAPWFEIADSLPQHEGMVPR
jgi:hypothetical protein